MGACRKGMGWHWVWCSGGSVPLTTYNLAGRAKSEMHIPWHHKAPLVVAPQGFPEGLSPHQGGR